MAYTTTFIYFIIYAFLGWICESTYKSIFRKKIINSGFLNGPLCPIYGFGALLIIYFLTPIKAFPILVFLLGVFSTSILEYFTSWLLEFLFHMSWWDYSKHKFNIHGRVCLLNAFLFGIMSLFVIYIVHPFTQSIIHRIDTNVQIIIAGLLFVMVIIDLIVSTISVMNMNKSLQKVHDYLHTIFENVDNISERIGKENEVIIKRLIKKREQMIKAFPNIKHKRFDISVKSLNEIIVKTKESIKNKLD